MKKKIVILGGGFGGVYTAIHLEKLARDPDIEITLVSRENFFLFTPMLHEVAASDLDLTNIVSPIRKLLRRVSFFCGDVQQIDLETKRISLCHGSDGHSHQMGYDCLVLALGSVPNFFNLPGLEQRAMTMKTLGDAIRLRNTTIARLEEADTECAAAVREPLMTFVVAGGGFAGVETIGGLNDFVRQSLKFYPHIHPDQIHMVLVHPGEVILPELGEELGRYAQKKLTRQKVDIRTQCKVTGVNDHGVALSDGSFVPSRTVIWTAGTSPNPLLKTLTCALERGRVKVNEYMEVQGYPGVYALGDCAQIPDLCTGGFYPPTAQHALRQGKTVAQNVAAFMGRGMKKPFLFSNLGQLAAIGRRTGVARILGVKFSGFVAWFLWRTIYLSKLPRFEKKLRVALDWTLDLFFSKDLVQFQADPTGQIADKLPAPQAGVPAMV